MRQTRLRLVSPKVTRRKLTGYTDYSPQPIGTSSKNSTTPRITSDPSQTISSLFERLTRLAQTQPLAVVAVQRFVVQLLAEGDREDGAPQAKQPAWGWHGRSR